MSNPNETESTQNTDTVEPMPGDATSPAPDVSGDASGVSILTLVDDVSTGDNVAPSIPMGRDGQPRRKPGRPRKNPLPQSDAPIQTQSTQIPRVVKTPAQNRAAKVTSDELARAIVNTTAGALSSLVGPEWAFETQEEATGMKMAVSAYIEAKGDGKISPESMLLLVIAGYALPRAQHENTRQKIGGFFKGLIKGVLSLFKRG